MREKEYDVLVIGDANVDLILRGADLTPDFGQAEKLIEGADMELGGSAAIFACGASRLGLRVGFVGKLGNDSFGEYLRTVMGQRGIDTSHILIDPIIRSGLTVHFSRPHDRAMLTFPGTIDAFSCDEIAEELFLRTRLVHLGSFYLQTRLHAGLAEFFQRIRSKGVVVSLDPGWDPNENWNGVMDRILDQIDLFMPNEQEARRITGIDSIDLAMRKLQKHGLLPVIKRGEFGASSLSSNARIDQPGFRVATVDTTGAGDSFNAGFLFAYLNGKDSPECLRWGCACGAFSTMYPGGIAGQPTQEQVVKFLSEQEMV